MIIPNQRISTVSLLLRPPIDNNVIQELFNKHLLPDQTNLNPDGFKELAAEYGQISGRIIDNPIEFIKTLCNTQNYIDPNQENYSLEQVIDVLGLHDENNRDSFINEEGKLQSEVDKISVLDQELLQNKDLQLKDEIDDQNNASQFEYNKDMTQYGLEEVKDNEQVLNQEYITKELEVLQLQLEENVFEYFKTANKSTIENLSERILEFKFNTHANEIQ